MQATESGSRTSRERRKLLVWWLKGAWLLPELLLKLLRQPLLFELQL
jgi:hypothetical protein